MKTEITLKEAAERSGTASSDLMLHLNLRDGELVSLSRLKGSASVASSDLEIIGRSTL